MSIEPLLTPGCLPARLRMQRAALLAWLCCTCPDLAQAQTTPPLLFEVNALRPKPTEVVTKAKTKVPAGTVTTNAGQFGPALHFSFVESTGPQFFTAGVSPAQNWNDCDGFSFWLKGDGSTNWGGLELIDGQDFSLRYGYGFPLAATDWTQITVPWRDLTPELAGPLVDAQTGFAPARFRNFWFGKWFYWREYPAHSFTIEQVALEKKIASDTTDYTPRQPGCSRLLAKLKAKTPVTVVTMGDSLSDKRHWANREQLWSELLASQLKTTYGGEVTLINPALGGTTLSQNLILMPRWLRQSPAPDLVVIWFGYNDWDSGVRGPRFQEYLQVAVDRLRRATHGGADLLLVTTCPSHGRWDTMNDMAQAVRETARTAKTGLADVAAEFHKITPDEALRQNYLAWDKTHLGPKGHQVVCEVVLKALQTPE